MKLIWIISIAFLFYAAPLFSQQWVQTASTPEGCGVTDMVVRQSTGDILVTTASYNWPSGDMGGIRRSTNDGNTWENFMDCYVARTICEGYDGNLYASIWPYPQDEGLYRSTNNGTNWTLLVSVPSGNNIFSIAQYNQLIYAGTGQGVYRSTNNGTSWAYSNNGIPPSSIVRDIEVDSSGIVAAATTNGLFVSTNSGDLWNQATGIQPGDTIVKLCFFYIDTSKSVSSELFAGTSNGILYLLGESTNFIQAVISHIFFNSPMMETSSMVVEYFPNQPLWISEKPGFVLETFFTGGSISQGGCWVSSDGGSNWQQNNTGLPNTLVSCGAGSSIWFRAGEPSDLSETRFVFYVGLFENTNGGAKVYKITYIIGIQQISSQVSDEYKLYQNYPNPFNPSTSIRFDMHKSSHAKLIIYNTLGEEVTTLVNEKLKTGTYEVNWDGMDYTSGVYFYKLITDDFVDVKKMVLVK